MSNMSHYPGEIFSAFPEADFVIANLEGSIISQNDIEVLPKRKALALYNTETIFSIIDRYSIRAVCLANNHTFDYQVSIDDTKNRLQQAHVGSFGAGSNLEDASNPLILSNNKSITVKIFAFGWDVIGCKLATPQTEGVNPFTPEHTLNTIRLLRRQDSSSFVIFMMHWNYEMELYPQPAHRQLAHDLIREGVDAIIGMHSHVAQGAEMVNGKPIIYGLGNWFFPSRRLNDHMIAFPTISLRQLALELDITSRSSPVVNFYWHLFNPDMNTVTYEKTEDWQGSILMQLTPFAYLSNKEYVKWFKNNRRKRLLLPCYNNYKHIYRNKFNDYYVLARQIIVDSLVRLKIKKGPRR